MSSSNGQFLHYRNLAYPTLLPFCVGVRDFLRYFSDLDTHPLRDHLRNATFRDPIMSAEGNLGCGSVAPSIAPSSVYGGGGGGSYKPAKSRSHLETKEDRSAQASNEVRPTHRIVPMPLI
jgi:hypothetical protein